MGLDTVELVMAYEEEFDIVITDASAEKLLTPRLTCELIESTLIRSGRPRPMSEIEELVRTITIEQLGLPEAEYHLDAEYVRDFGAD